MHDQNEKGYGVYTFLSLVWSDAYPYSFNSYCLIDDVMRSTNGGDRFVVHMLTRHMCLFNISPKPRSNVLHD
jgi:hypothetical protein